MFDPISRVELLAIVAIVAGLYWLGILMTTKQDANEARERER